MIPPRRLAYFSLLLVTVALLAGCSPEGSNTPAQDSAQIETNQDNGADAADQLDQTIDPAAAGWRKGRLRINLEVSQSGSKVTEAGAKRTEITWSNQLTASAEYAVEVIDDLSLSVPSDGDEETRYEAWRSDPYYPIDGETPQLTGTGSAEARVVEDSPTANDFVKTVTTTQLSIELQDLRLDYLRHSLVGKGHEAKTSIDLYLNGNSRSEFYPVGGGEVVVTESPIADANPLSFTLYPAPNPEGLNDYIFWRPDAPQSEIDQEREKFLDLWRLLKTIHADAVPVQTDLRAGAITKATKNSLELRYQYGGANQVAFFLPGLESLAAPANTNSLVITITLTADE